MTRVLVTGATGLIGRAVVPVLRDAGFEVVTTSRSSSPVSGHVRADLAERGQVDRLLAVTDPQVVLHLAGGPASGGDELVRSNVDTTSTLLHALAARGVLLERLVVVGSAAEYGEGQGQPLREDHPAVPVTTYGRAKLAQRLLVLLMGAQVARSTVLPRPFNVVAPDLPASTPLGNLRRQLARADEAARVEVACGRLDLVRDFVSVGAVARALAMLLCLDEAPAAVNLCSGRPTALRDLFDRVAQRSGRVVDFVPDAELAGLPAAGTVVGDARVAQDLGLLRAETVDELALALLGGLVPTGATGG